MTLYDDILDLLDLVGRRDCMVRSVYIYEGCSNEECEPCTARKLYARLVEARDRVEP